MRHADPELRADRRRVILAAAVRAFAHVGFHKATMPDIAREAGMSAANLYRYFTSRDVLVAALVEKDRAAAKAEIRRRLAGGDPCEAILAIIAAQMAEDASETMLALEIFAQSQRDPALGGQVRAADADIRATLAEALAEAAADGRLRAGVAPAEAATLLLALADGLLWRRAADAAFDGPRLLTEMRGLLAAYLAPP